MAPSMTTIRLHINGQDHAVDAPPNARLLDVLHDPLGLRGTRFGCGANQCGACHVLVGDRSLPACDTPLWAVQDQAITTVEGLSPVLRQAFIDEQAAQPSIGQSVQRPDLPALLAGAAHFIHDLAPPGMLHGRVLHPPQWGAQVLAWDEAAARACPGLLHLQRDGQLFGVVAASGADADAALAALVASLTWSTLDSPADEADDLQRLPAKITLVGEKLAPPTSTAAATAAAPSSAPATRHLQARYTKPWIAHASLAPSCALARWGDDGHLHVWSHSQGIFNLRRDLALAFSMPADKVRVSHARGAGCYGHNGADDVAFDAAWLARALPGRTVRLLWRRADEFNHSPQGPAMVVEISAEITDQTRVNEPCSKRCGASR